MLNYLSTYRLFLFILFISSLSFVQTVCIASITKKDIAQKVKVDTKRLLIESLPPNAADSAHLELIESRSKKLSDTVLLLKDDQINDDIARWIEDSISQTVESEVFTLTSNTPASTAIFQRLIQQVGKRFITMDNVKGEQMLEKRRVALISEKAFRRSLEDYLLDKLSNVASYRVILTPTALLGTTGTGFEGVINSLNINHDINYNLNQINRGDINLLNQQIDSQLLLLVLVHQINSALISNARRGTFDYGNLLSAFYDTDSPLAHISPKNFAEVNSEVEQFYHEWCMNDSGVAILNLHRFDLFFYQCEYLRMSQTFKEQSESFSSGKEQSLTVSFNNEPHTWSLLKQAMQ